MKKQIVLGITGASGACYTRKLIEKLSGREEKIFMVASANGRKIFEEETGLNLSEFVKDFKNFVIEDEKNFFSPIASGSNDFDVLICPCSMGFLSRCASGISQSLLERAVDVALKERNRVLLVIRESPLNLIHLENMLKISRAGAIVMPASPFFYYKPTGIDELVNDFADRVLKVFLTDYNIDKRWSSFG